jgi:hypothetical protein
MTHFDTTPAGRRVKERRLSSSTRAAAAADKRRIAAIERLLMEKPTATYREMALAANMALGRVGQLLERHEIPTDAAERAAQYGYARGYNAGVESCAGVTYEVIA